MAKVTQEIDLKFNEQSLKESLGSVSESAKEADKSINDLQKDLDKLSKSSAKGNSEEVKSRMKLIDEEIAKTFKLTQQWDEVKKHYQDAMRSGDTEQLRQVAQEFANVKQSGVEAYQAIANAKAAGIDVSGSVASLQTVSKEFKAMSSSLTGKIKSNIVGNITPAIQQISNLVRKSITNTLSFARSSVSKYFGLLRGGFSSLFSFIKKQFSGISNLGSGAFGSMGGLFRQLRGLVGIAGLGYLTKEMMTLASTAVNVEGTLDNVFEESKNDIRDWSDEFAHRFSLTVEQARSFATEFGTSLSNLGISGSAQSEMAKNLTALSGDIASFYGKSLEDSSKILEQAIVGNTRGLKQLGIVMNETTLNEYAMARGYSETYSQMNNTNKAIVRYNYLLSQTTKMQGNASVSINSWTTQIRMLKSNLQALGSLMGGALIKLLYPIVTVLNTITASAVTAFNALAKLLGFQPIQLAQSLGSAADIGDISDALEDEADAYDDVSKSAKKAQDNIQGFDKLNNMQSETASSAITNNAGSAGAGLLDFDSYYDSVADVGDANQKLKEYLDELWKLLSEHDYYGAGKHIADGINYLVDEVYKALSDPRAYQAIDTFSDGITDFYNGLLSIDMVKAGQMLGAGFNLITYAINTLYNDAVSKDLLKQTGAKIADFFIGLDKEVDFKAAGQAFATGFRVMMDVARGFFDQAEANELANKIGQDVKQFFIGAIDRAFGQQGAKEIGENIASLINFAFDFTIGLLGDGKLASKLGDSIVTIINTSISNIDEGKLTAAASSLLNTIGILFSKLGDIDAEGLSDSIAGAINGVANNGSLSKAASGFSKAFLKIVEVIGDTITKVDWFKVGDAILNGIADAIKSNPKGGDYFAKALGIVFTATLASGALSLSLRALGQGITQAIANSIASGAGVTATTTAGAALGTKFGYALLYAAAAVVGVAGGNIIGSKLAEILGAVETKYLQDMIDKYQLGGNTSETLMTKTIPELEAFRLKIEDIRQAYVDLGSAHDNSGAFDFGDDVLHYKDLIDLQNVMREYTQDLIDNGYATDGVRSANEILNDNYLTAIERSTALSNALILLEQDSADAALRINELDTSTQDATQTFGTNLIDGLSSASLALEHIALETGQNYTESLKSGLSADDVSEGFISQLNVGANAAQTQAPIAGASIATAYAAGLVGSMLSDTTVSTSAQQNITNAGVAAQAQAPIAGVSTAVAYASGLASTIDSDTSVTTATVGNISEAGNQASVEAINQGQEVGQTTVDSISGTIESDTTTGAALKSNVDNATSAASKDAETKGKGIGDHIINGIGNGLNASEAIQKLKDKVKSLCDTVVNTAKSILKIHSPSRVFEEMFEWVPEGAALGIKTNADTTYKAAEDMSKELIRKFDVDSVDVSNILDISKVSDVMLEARSKITDSLSGISSNIGVSSDMLIQPRFKKTELQAITSQGAMNSTIEQKLANLSSKVGLNKGSGQMNVAVYLDATNKLADFVIDTVNGQVVKGGMF